MKLKLVGISKRGKDKIKAHGEWWDVVKEGEFKLKSAWLFKSILTENLRWVFINNDPDFDIVNR
jgi:hypothetical protein